MDDLSEKIEEILRKYDRKRDFKEYFEEIYLVFFEPNLFESEGYEGSDGDE